MVLLLAAAILAPVPADAKLLPRLVAPPDGYSYFGFTFALFDSNELVWGAARPFAERIQELAGKTPTFLNVGPRGRTPTSPASPVPLSNWEWMGRVLARGPSGRPLKPRRSVALSGRPAELLLDRLERLFRHEPRPDGT